MIIEETIKKASKTLKDSSIPTHELDAQIILSDIVKIKRENLILDSKINISRKNINIFEAAIRRRAKKEPVAYITGRKEFWSENFIVNKATLIPRPETELLIYKLIDLFKNKRINILDIGTGSGCIILSILKELKLARGTGIDICHKAIRMAKKNSENLNLNKRVKFKVLDLNRCNLGKYDLIVSNPPYIPSIDIKNLSKDIKNYEPLIALHGGVDGLDLIKKVIYKSNHLLKKSGLLSLEIGYRQYQKVNYILKKHGYREISKEYDYNRNVRCILSTKVNFFKI